MSTKFLNTRSVTLLTGLVVTLIALLLFKKSTIVQTKSSYLKTTSQVGKSDVKSVAQVKPFGTGVSEIKPDPDEEKNQQVRLQFVNQINQLVLSFNKLEKQKLLEQAFKNPQAFAEVSNEFLEQLPFDQIEVRNELLGLVIDTSEYLNQTEELKFQSESFFKMAKAMVIREMKSPEFIETNQLDSLSQYQLRTLAHEGSVIEKNGNFLRSSLSTKVMALSLAAQHPNYPEKEEILMQLESSGYGNMEKETNESLILIAKNLFNSK